MKRLIQKEKYMHVEKQLKKITQKIAAAALVMLVGALTVTICAGWRYNPKRRG